MASALAHRLVLAGVSGSTFFYIDNHVNIALMYIWYVIQINEHSGSDSVGGNKIHVCKLLKRPSHNIYRNI